MKKKITKQFIQLYVLILLLSSCKQNIKPEEITLINGYWEIEKVVFNNGNEKLYPANETYDFFELDIESKGFRKKVNPQLNGSFLVNNTFESIRLLFKEDKIYVAYSTPYSIWEEEIVEISKDKLVLRNQQGSEYHYKRATPITVLSDGKKK